MIYFWKVSWNESVKSSWKWSRRTKWQWQYRHKQKQQQQQQQQPNRLLCPYSHGVHQFNPTKCKWSAVFVVRIQIVDHCNICILAIPFKTVQFVAVKVSDFAQNLHSGLILWKTGKTKISGPYLQPFWKFISVDIFQIGDEDTFFQNGSSDLKHANFEQNRRLWLQKSGLFKME